MYILLIKHFFRSKTVVLAFSLLMLLGMLSIGSGKQFLNQKKIAITKTIEQQKKHIKTQRKYNKDDIGLLSYYLKFSFLKPLEPLAAISMGQSDLNTDIQNVSIVALEGQKHNTDLVNPMRQQVGNLDISFLIIFLFPLVIIALNFNLLSEEEEKGTWKMIKIQSKSSFKFLITKLSIRLLFISMTLGILFLIASFILEIPFTESFLDIILMSYLYIIFWFALCFFVILLRKSSNTNAIILLASWLTLVVFLPIFINNYINKTYPIEEAFSMVIKQRDAYHKKWDTDKKETLNRFYEHYPHLKKYGYKTEGFSWLWYYAMQQLGDDDSKEEREALYNKIKKREALSKKMAQFFPPLQLQLSMNEIAKTSLTNHINFLDATVKFHEDIRLDIYPKVFEKHHPDTVDFEKHKPKFFRAEDNFSLSKNSFSTILITLFLICFGVFKNLKYFK
ncbi:DUF3526 domain-containing protein [Polaribacter batillariae]|uniref:DUF3526 domain-containing protein n=1 Tax=Polaribacter batillariae TaxID=2808900 RepID=A0ABX7SVT9_9FLAO|nr:DUF3526 domain-containing protein [Polaribacter batillariae]QTD38360.1 DUF3526 domain-containing protein [Polaribacter batillariae]